MSILTKAKFLYFDGLNFGYSMTLGVAGDTGEPVEPVADRSTTTSSSPTMEVEVIEPKKLFKNPDLAPIVESLKQRRPDLAVLVEDRMITIGETKLLMDSNWHPAQANHSVTSCRRFRLQVMPGSRAPRELGIGVTPDVSCPPVLSYFDRFTRS